MRGRPDLLPLLKRNQKQSSKNSTELQDQNALKQLITGIRELQINQQTLHNNIMLLKHKQELNEYQFNLMLTRKYE